MQHMRHKHIVTSPATRDRIVALADKLFYEQGYEHTSFADIASAVNISRGNFYHHFKSKDDILDAVIHARLAHTQSMLDKWELEGHTPLDRIGSFIHILVANQRSIRRHGCPVGTLCTELAKRNHPAQGQANKLFTLFRTWLRTQFVLLGHRARADKMAMHVLARSQGIATMANAFDDAAFIKEEVHQLLDWLHTHAK